MPLYYSKNGIGQTSIDALILQNMTAATAGTQQWSPRLRLSGQSWNPDSGKSSPVDWIIENQTFNTPGSGGVLTFGASQKGAPFQRHFALDESGRMRVGRSENFNGEDFAGDDLYVAGNETVTGDLNVVGNFSPGSVNATSVNAASVNSNDYRYRGNNVHFSVPLFDHFADAGNNAMTQTKLYQDTLYAGQLANDGDKLQLHYAGTFIGSATAGKEIKMLISGSVDEVVFDTGVVTVTSGSSWDLEILIVRESQFVVRCISHLTCGGLPTSAPTQYVRLESEDVDFKNTNNNLVLYAQAIGAGGASNQVIASVATGEYRPAH